MDKRLHGGDVYRNQITMDFSININPLGMPDGVKNRLAATISDWERYPDPRCGRLRRDLAEYYQVKPEQILCGNGAADLIFQLVMAVRPRQALLLAPSFSEYEEALRGADCRIFWVELKEEHGFRPDMEELRKKLTPDLDLFFLCNPNNPTGVCLNAEQVAELAEICCKNGILLVADECFLEFLDEPERYSLIPEAARGRRVLVLKAFTKTYAMAGLRLGFAICPDTELLSRMEGLRQPWSVSVPAQEAGCAALRERVYLEKTRTLVRTERNRMEEGLGRLGFRVTPSSGNFLLFYVDREEKLPGGSLYEACCRRKILIRDCSNFRGLGQGYYRVCIRRAEENRNLLEQLHQITDNGKGEGQHELVSDYTGG